MSRSVLIAGSRTGGAARNPRGTTLCASEVPGVVVILPGGPRAINISGEEVPVERFTEQVVELLREELNPPSLQL